MRLRLDHRARTGLLVGGVAMFFALDIAFLASLAGFAFAPDAFGQALIEVMPGFIVVPLIGLLQFWAKRLLVAGVLVGFLGCGAIAGALAVDPRRRDRTVIAVGARAAMTAVQRAGAMSCELAALGERCMVVSPALVPKRAGDHVKTDRRDSERLASLARAGELEAIHVPDMRDEAIRDLVRGRDDAVIAQRRVRQQLKALLVELARVQATLDK